MLTSPRLAVALDGRSVGVQPAFSWLCHRRCGRDRGVREPRPESLGPRARRYHHDSRETSRDASGAVVAREAVERSRTGPLLTHPLLPP
jgi:hypothetical protein